MTPVWIVDDQWRDLNPPAIVMKLGETRSPENLLRVPAELHVTTAKRYQPIPGGATWCNIFLADALHILRAEIPHWWDPDGGGPLPKRELNANAIVDNLRAGKFDGWSPIAGSASLMTDVSARAGQGLPTVAGWRNPSGKSGHVVLVVPTPAGKTGVYVSGAGRQCIHQCPISSAFGPYLPQVEFYGHE